MKNKMLKAKYHNSLTVYCTFNVYSWGGGDFIFIFYFFRERGIITVDIKLRGNAMTFSG